MTDYNNIISNVAIFITTAADTKMSTLANVFETILYWPNVGWYSTAAFIIGTKVHSSSTGVGSLSHIRHHKQLRTIPFDINASIHQ